MRTTRTRALAVIAGLAMLQAACGGGGGGTGSGGGNPPPANRAPTISNPNDDQVISENRPFTYDVLQGGTTFRDQDGDPLTITVEIFNGPAGLSVVGTQIVGPATEPGSIVIEVSARDAIHDPVKDVFGILINPNSVPVVVNPNPHFLLAAGATINHDATQSETTFTDADGDTLTYEMAVTGLVHALTVTNSHVIGSMPGVGLARVKITASDGFGGIGENEFSIAVPAAEPGRPVLPAIPYVYNDDELPLPYVFREMKTDPGSPFMDTTPPHNPTTNAGAALGRVLFYDKRMSITNTHACGSCHKHERGFGSPDRFSIGALGLPLPRHAMSLSNVRYNRRNNFFSDERAMGLEQLALMPIEAPLELGNPIEMLEQKLAAVDFYPPLFQAAFGTSTINRERIALALAQFLRSMITYRSRFDRAHYGPDRGPPPNPEIVLTDQELRGFEVFIFSGCQFCHQPAAHASPNPTSNGLDATLTDPGTIEGVGWFRAASLRNIQVSAPYMHDGRFATLRDVIEHYDHGVQRSPGLHIFFFEANGGAGTRQLMLPEEDKLALEAFLNSFTDPEFLADPKFSDPF